jgi:hypothetical protein
MQKPAHAPCRYWYAALLLVVLVAQVSEALTPSAASAISPSSCPPLSTPSGNVINVSTEPTLQTAIANLRSGDTLIIAQGTYRLTNSLYLPNGIVGVSIRGATGNRDDVILLGPGMNNANIPFGFWTGNVQNLTFADFTIKDINQHAFIFNAGTESPIIHNVRMVDVGDQSVKSNPDGQGGGVDNGIVECSLMEYTTVAPDGYTNGVDVHTGKHWIVRNNAFKNIRGPAGQPAGPAILMWNNSQDSISEGNLFLNCERGIAYGLINKVNDHLRGIIRNNIFYRSASQSGDVGIGVASSPGTKVLNNTVIMSGTYPSAIEYRFANTVGVEVVNNLSDTGIQSRDGASAQVSNNLTNAQTSWFANTASGDLHILPVATTAIDRALPHPDVVTDYDGQIRLLGSAPDIGADEFSATDTQPPNPPTELRVVIYIETSEIEVTPQ